MQLATCSCPNLTESIASTGGLAPEFNGHTAEIAVYVQQVMFNSHPPTPPIERRKDRRVAFPHILQLSFLNKTLGISEKLSVVGKSLSIRGLDFYHRYPITPRLVTIQFDFVHIPAHELLLELSWCRYIRDEWYASGGRFLKIINQS